MNNIIVVKSMRIFKKVLISTLYTALLTFSIAAKAKDKVAFPESLFEVKLGGIYTIDQEKGVGTMPVKEFKGMQEFLGNGIHYYFKPLKDYKAFKYVEKRKEPNDAYFETSFRLYLLPVIPSTIKNAEELTIQNIKWEVAVIEWSDRTKREEDAYFWAIDLCKSIRVDLEREPEITDEYNLKICRCKFTEGHKELKIESLDKLKLFNLLYPNPVFDKKNEVIDTLLRKIQMKDIKPY
jgi:hypothetical protein